MCQRSGLHVALGTSGSGRGKLPQRRQMASQTSQDEVTVVMMAMDETGDREVGGETGLAD